MASSLFDRGVLSHMRTSVFAAMLAAVIACIIVPCAFAAPSSSLSLKGAVSSVSTEAQFSATGTGVLFVDVRADGALVAKGLQVSVDSDSTTLSLNGVVPTRTYELSFFDAPHGEAVFTGSAAAVYAQCGDSAELLGIRTAIDGVWAQFCAPASYNVDGARYVLTSDKGVESDDGTLTFAYELDSSVSDLGSITGTISYVDPSGKVVRVDKLPEFLKGTGTLVPSLVFASDGAKTTAYQVMGLKAGESLRLVPDSGQTDFVVYVRELAATSSEGSYDVTIKYVANAGSEVLFSDTLTVNKTYRYTAPEQFYQVASDGTVKAYKLDASFASNNPIELKPGEAPDGNVVEIPYNLVESNQNLTWTVQLLNGSDGKSTPLAEAYTVEVKPGQTTTFEAKPLEVDGVTFYPVGVPEGQSMTLSYTYGDANLLDTLYYVPADFAADAYNVTVQYVNLADNSVIGKKTLHADPDSQEDLLVSGPENLEIDGETFVRLAGQEQPRRHNFFNSTRLYTVYYRNANDDLLQNSIVKHTVVTTTHRVEETVVTVANGTQTAATPVATTLTQGETDMTVVQRDADDANTSSLANNAGVDTGTERSVIEGDLTPLASGAEAASSEQAEDSLPVGLIAAIAAVAVLAVALVAFFAKKRKSTSHEEGGARNA